MEVGETYQILQISLASVLIGAHIFPLFKLKLVHMTYRGQDLEKKKVLVFQRMKSKRCEGEKYPKIQEKKC